MSPGWAITLEGMKVRALFAPTVTCQVAAYTDEDRTNSKRNGVEKCILAFWVLGNGFPKIREGLN